MTVFVAFVRALVSGAEISDNLLHFDIDNKTTKDTWGRKMPGNTCDEGTAQER